MHEYFRKKVINYSAYLASMLLKGFGSPYTLLISQLFSSSWLWNLQNDIGTEEEIYTWQWT